jgi:hypothetical protein
MKYLIEEVRVRSEHTKTHPLELHANSIEVACQDYIRMRKVSSDPRNPHNWSLKVTNITESDLKVDSVHVNVLYIPPKEEEWFYSQWGYFLDEKIGD